MAAKYLREVIKPEYRLEVVVFSTVAVLNLTILGLVVFMVTR